ncbi:MAG TPA: hypothetical protein DCE42_06650 [Myxococcales bacterium]|nr:hypothetical protein [Deltaproteobacteria bacterium]MBU48500.1 hypothetical protein [Deltaproteobacteria bacterium]HAA54416.1 hypothetical protein [Myxococcales bacterium]
MQLLPPKAAQTWSPKDFCSPHPSPTWSARDSPSNTTQRRSFDVIEDSKSHTYQVNTSFRKQKWEKYAVFLSFSKENSRKTKDLINIPKRGQSPSLSMYTKGEQPASVGDGGWLSSEFRGAKTTM